MSQAANSLDKKQPDGGPAFPAAGMLGHGMTLRDYFAARALRAFIRRANNVMFGANYPDNNMNYALAAYAMADAMLKAREVKS